MLGNVTYDEHPWTRDRRALRVDGAGSRSSNVGLCRCPVRLGRASPIDRHCPLLVREILT